jgi:hypothetical protein
VAVPCCIHGALANSGEVSSNCEYYLNSFGNSELAAAESVGDITHLLGEDSVGGNQERRIFTHRGR